MSIDALYKIYKQYPSIQTDTRKLQQGDIYFALKGPNFNGNTFAQAAIDRGASYAIIDEEEFAIKEKTILVTDVLETLQQLALHHRRLFSIPFLAITGSNGKTTTKELIYAVLSSKLKTYTTQGNLNNHIGVPLTMLQVKADAQIAVIEMGANHQKEIESYCRYTMPTHGLITNCGKAHLEGFGGVEGVRKGKGELFDYLREHEGSAFIMTDYDYLKQMSRGIKEIVTYGTANAHTTGNSTQSDPFLIVQFTKGFSGEIKTLLVGDYNLPNVLAAVSVGKFFGIEDEYIKAAIEAYTPSNSRSQLIQKGSNKIILDAYNANPSSMKAAIQNFARTDNDNKILVLGAMAELGGESMREHQSIIDEIGNYRWQHVLVVGGHFLQMRHPYLSFSSAAEAGEWLKKKNIQNSYLLIKGSRSIAMETVLDYL